MCFKSQEVKMNRIKINVSGEVFETDMDLMKEKQFHKLAELHKESINNGNTSEVIVNRPPGTFGAILTYFLTDELHLPPAVCPGIFKRELDFWDVDTMNLQECCQYRLQTFTDEESTRKEFITKSTRQSSDSAHVLPSGARNFVRVRAKLWGLLNNNENSIPAKLYFGLVFVMVLLSILVLALNTEPQFRRSLSTCELLDYLNQVDYDEFDAVDSAMGNPDCSKGIFAGEHNLHGNEDWYEKLHNDKGGNKGNNNKQRNKPPPPPATESPATTTTGDLVATTNEGSWNFTTTTFYPYDSNFSDLIGIIETLSLPIPALVNLDFLVNAFFSLDLLLRLVSCPSLKQYFLSPLNLLDALALLSSYLYFIITSVERELMYVDSKWMFMLEFMQVFRALRLFRVVKNVRASKVLAYSLMQNLKDMSLLVMLLIVGISTFACLIYVVEARDTVQSIPMGWYWAIITMTTVGYGDIYPKTPLGHGIATVCAISGVLLLAVTLPMFVNNFLCLYQYSCVNESIEKNKKSKEKRSTILPLEEKSVTKNLENVSVDSKSSPIFVKQLSSDECLTMETFSVKKTVKR